MEYQAFALKWRPKTFDEVVGQEHITTTLKNAIRQKRVAHAFLFTGPRGTGKTSTARILAKALNCKKGPAPTPCNECQSCLEIDKSINLDVLEIDGASNNGVDEVRVLRENIKLSPSSSRYKIYIIDEVHMLSASAFNALLKTLEEPPEHVKFIFATTQPRKVLATIISRCQRFDFRRISTKEIAAKLKEIAKKEKLVIEEEAIYAIARSANGGLRDAESLLDQASSYSDKKIETAHISSILGTVGQDVIFEITEKIINKDTKKVLELFDNLIKRGKDLSVFISEFIEHLRNLLVAKEVDTYKDFIDAPEENLKKIKEQEAGFQKEELLYAFSLFSKALYELPHYPSGRIPVEVILIKLTAKGGMVKAGELLAKVEDLEKKLKEPSTAYGVKEESDFSKYGLPEKTALAKGGIKKEAEDNSPPAADIERARTVKSGKDEGVGFDWDDFQPVWEKACNAVKEKRTSLGLYISEGEPVNLKDGVLTVGFHPGFSFHKESLEVKKNKELIEQIFSDTLEKKIKMVFVDINTKKKKPALKVREKAVSKKKAKPEAAVQPQEEDSIIASAKSLFSGLLIKNDEPGPAS